MIEQNNNVLTDKSITRTVDFNPNDKQITFLDSRFYQRNGKFYPSVTYILSFIPKNKIFIDWLREKGDDSETIMKAAGERGKQVHGAIEKLLANEEVSWIAKDGTANYNLEVWQMILKFVEFWQIHTPKLVGSEIHVFSDKYEYAGTIDLLVEMNKELWLIDLKTSNQVPPVYMYQIASYVEAFNECFDRKIERRGILWLKSQTRKSDKTGKKMRGKGWSLIEPDKSLEDDFKSFQLFHEVFKHEAEYLAPLTEFYPTTIRL